MAVAASLNVLLTAQTAQFTSSMKKAEKTLTGFSKVGTSVSSAMSKLKGGLAVVGVSLAAGAVASQIRSTVSAIDDAGDAAERLGVTFQNFRAIQESSLKNGGVSFEVISDAIEKMNLNIGKAGKVRETLKGIGLSTSQLVTGSPDQKFLLIVEALRGVESAGKRAAIIQEVFGKNAREVGNIAALSADQFEQWKRSSMDLSGQLSGEQLDAFNEMQAAVEQIGRAWDKFAERAVAALAPTIKMVLELGNAVMDIDLTGQATERAKENSQAKRDEAKLPARFAPKFVPPELRAKTISSMFTGPAKDFGDAAAKALNKALFTASVMRINERKAQEAKEQQSQRNVGVWQALGGGVADYMARERDRRSQTVPAATAISAGSQADAMFSFQRQQENDNAKVLKIDQQQVNLLQQLVTIGRQISTAKPEELGPF
jgi:hypothetical protein